MRLNIQFMKDFLDALKAAIIQEDNIKHEGGIQWRVNNEQKIAMLKDILSHHKHFRYIKEKSSYEDDLTEVMFQHSSGENLLITWRK